MKLRLFTLLAACWLVGCTTTPPPPPAQPAPQGWEPLGWGSNSPSLAPVTNTVTR